MGGIAIATFEMPMLPPNRSWVKSLPSTCERGRWPSGELVRRSGKLTWACSCPSTQACGGRHPERRAGKGPLSHRPG
jgi:hypothetical protein